MTLQETQEENLEVQVQDDVAVVEDTMTAEEINAVILKRIQDHNSEFEFDEEYFLDLLMHSLSLSLSEKKKVVDAMPTLSEFQVEELILVFEDEREKFRDLASEHPEDIKILLKRQQKDWSELGMIYAALEEKEASIDEDAQKIEDIKANLGL